MSPAGRVAALFGIALAHVIAVSALVVPLGPRDWIALFVFFVLGSFTIAAALHRYFAHRAFRTSRGFQLAMATLVSCLFGDPIGFAGKHRLHHRHADTERDPHGPGQGAWRCWIGHLLDDGGWSEAAIVAAAPDLAAFPELRWLHRFYVVPGIVLTTTILFVGGYGMLVAYAFVWLTLALHGPALVNYFCHRWGSRRFETADRSTNNWLLAALLSGEGWHNNHHHFPGAAHAGLRWYEWDAAYYMLKVLSWLGLVWDLHVVRAPADAVAEEGEPCASR